MILDQWRKDDHPRGKGGKFVKKGGGSSESPKSKKVTNPKYQQISQKSKVENNTKKVSTQFTGTGPKLWNEYTFYSSSETISRQTKIMQATGCGFMDAMRMQRAICGRLPSDYKDRGIMDQPGWCWHGDKDIRNLANPRAVKQAQALHDYVKMSPKYDGTVYRGMSLPDEMVDKLVQGATFQQNGAFSSWSAKRDIAQDFAYSSNQDNGGTRVVFQLDKPSYGVPFAHLSLFPIQDQVLVSNIQRNNYRISKVTRQNFRSGRTHFVNVTLQEVD